MVITGLVYNSDYLSQYLIREQKKAEKEHIEFSEFIGRTIKVIEDLEGEFYRLRAEKRDQLDNDKNGATDDAIEKLKDKVRVTEDFKLQLELYTEGEFNGHISFWDLNKVRFAINEAFDFYSIEQESNNDEPVKYYLRNDTNSKGNTETVAGKYPQIFDNKSFEIWQTMFDSFQVNSSSRTDVKFMFEIMQKEGLIYENIREVDFLKWVNETYNLEVQKRSYADLKNNKRLAVFNYAKELSNSNK